MRSRSEYTLWQKALAWSVHLFTALGGVAGMLALFAIMEDRWRLCFLWLFAATAIDGFDGLLARAFGVKRVLPHFDGALLDNIVDYLTYVVVPAVLMYAAGLFPESVAGIAAGMIVLTSAYQFCQADAKTDDHSFRGFPSYWNVVALYLFLLDLQPWVNFAVVTVLAVLVFLPMKYLYPSRVTRHRTLTMILTTVWGVIILAMLLRYPKVDPRLVWASLLYVVYYIAMSIHLAGGLKRWVAATGR